MQIRLVLNSLRSQADLKLVASLLPQPPEHSDRHVPPRPAGEQLFEEISTGLTGKVLAWRWGLRADGERRGASEGPFRSRASAPTRQSADAAPEEMLHLLEPPPPSSAASGAGKAQGWGRAPSVGPPVTEEPQQEPELSGL